MIQNKHYSVTWQCGHCGAKIHDASVTSNDCWENGDFILVNETCPNCGKKESLKVPKEDMAKQELRR